MSQTTMETLPNDLLLEIFDYLHGKDLKSCALVCKDWNTVIGGSASTMRKLPLKLGKTWERKKEEVASLCRNFHAVSLWSVKINSELLEIIQEKFSHVRLLKMHFCPIAHKSLEKLLSSMPMIEKVVVEHCTFADDVIAQIEPFSLPTLKTLVIIQSIAFLNYLIKSNTQVRELKVFEHQFDDQKAKILEDFLIMQTNLTALAINVNNGLVYRTLGQCKQNIKFQLKRLSVYFAGWSDDSNVEDAFIEFLASQKATLVNLEMTTFNKLSEKLFVFFVKHLELNRLIIDGSDLPLQPMFYNAIPSNRHLKTLKIDDVLRDGDVARGLFHVYPDINKLVATWWDDALINSFLISMSRLKNLQYLHIPRFTNDTPEVAIESLKTLHVDYVDFAAQWQRFVMSNPSIETISVGYSENDTFTYEIIDAITRRLPNLKHFKFGPGYKPTTRTLEMMSRNAPKLRKVEIYCDPPNEDFRNTTFGALNVIYFPYQAWESVFPEEKTMGWG